MAPQSPIHPWRRPLIRGLGARSSVTGSVFPTDMGYIGASGFASEKYFHRREPGVGEGDIPNPPTPWHRLSGAIESGRDTLCRDTGRDIA